jgi:hypothetical protein
MARHLDVIGFDHQREVVRNTDSVCYFQAGADQRQIAHPAIDAAVLVEGSAARFQGAMAWKFASLVHGFLRRDRCRVLLHGLAD